jgi:hypothetical protein
MRAGRKRPDPLPQLIAAHRRRMEAAREKYQPDSTFLIGKSMAAGSAVTVARGKSRTALFVLDIRFAPWAIARNSRTKFCVR